MTGYMENRREVQLRIWLLVIVFSGLGFSIDSSSSSSKVSVFVSTKIIICHFAIVCLINGFSITFSKFRRKKKKKV